jgi:hypothetical protein
MSRRKVCKRGPFVPAVHLWLSPIVSGTVEGIPVSAMSPQNSATKASTARGRLVKDSSISVFGKTSCRFSASLRSGLIGEQTAWSPAEIAMDLIIGELKNSYLCARLIRRPTPAGFRTRSVVGCAELTT